MGMRNGALAAYHTDELSATLFEESGDALFLFDPTTEQLLDVNPMAQRLSGFTRPELLRLKITYLLRSEVQGGLQRLRHAYRKTGLFHSQEGFLLRHHNEGLWIPVNLTITRLHAEQETLGLVTARDVREQREMYDRLKKMEADLRATLASVSDSEARYRELFENANDIIYTHDLQGNLQSFNHAGEKLFGYTSEEFTAMNIAALVVPEQLERAKQMIAQKVKSGGRTIYELECLTKDRRRLAFEVSTRLIYQEGKPAYVQGIARDIAERKRADEVIRASEARYRTLVENLEQSVFLKDTELRFLAVNRPFAGGLSCPEDEIVGKTDFDFYPAHLAEKYQADDRRVLSEGKRLELEEQNLMNGQMRSVRTIKTPVSDEQGHVIGVLGIFWDVTEQRALEAQLRQAQKMEAIGQLAGGIAHDFNNLLTAILGNLSLVLSAYPEQDPNRPLLEEAEKASSRAADLIRQMLSLSRRAPINLQCVNLNAIVEEVVSLVRRSIDPRIVVDVQCQPNLGTVRADPGEMNQVLMNLCLNARDAMPSGGQLLLTTQNIQVDELHQRACLEARLGSFVRLRIQDTGNGIPPEIRARIFEPFFTTKEPGKGTGLGLAMVFGIVKQHQGWIECQSELNKGTCFDIYLPLSSAPDGEVSSQTSSAKPSTGNETILLVDDEASLRNLGRAILERYGYEVILAENGLQAVDTYRRGDKRIDLIVLDLTMPCLSGADTLRQLIQMDPNVRVVLASGYSPEQILPSEGGQVLGFIGKPFSADELAHKVRLALDEASALEN